MNVAMENTQEVVEGQIKNSYGDAFIRGNNGMRLLQRFKQSYSDEDSVRAVQS
jgi:hypothetical protein